MTRVGLGLDGGGSSSRWLLLASDGAVLGEGRTGPLTGHLYRGEDEQLGRFRKVLEEARALAQPDAFVAGLTGMHAGTVALERYTQIITEVLGLEPSRILIGDDMHIAYAGAFRPDEGVLVYAGTGSIAYYRTASGDVLRTGGYGYLIDDAGGGYSLGREALKVLLRHYDALGAPPETPLARALYAKLGSRDWDAMMPVVYEGGRTFVASLAPAVAAAAEAGDEAAQAVLKTGGVELARLVTDLFRRLGGPRPVAFAGGIARLSPILTGALEHTLRTRVRVVTEEPVWAAARLALTLAEQSL